MPLSRRRSASLLAAVLLVASSSVLAVKPAKWVHQSEADFLTGVQRSVVVTSQGELRLSRAVRSLYEVPKPTADGDVATPPAAVLSLAQAKDGTVYAGTGVSGQILAIKDGKSSVFATLPGDDVLVTALLADAAGNLYAAASGERGQVYKFKPGSAEPTALLDGEIAENTAYVWALAAGPEGSVYAVTGSRAALLSISPEGKATTLFTSEEDNFISLAVGADGRVYFGSDPHGLVYRYDPKEKRATVLFDAPETEITALSIDAAGNLFAGTGAAVEIGSMPGPVDASGNKGLPEPMPPLPGLREPGPTPEPPNQPPQVDPKKGAEDPKPADPKPAEPKPAEPGPRNLSSLFAAAPSGPTSAALTELQKKLDKADAASTPDLPADGNAIYRIDTEGFVGEVLRLQATVHAMHIAADGTIAIATGPDGLLYQYDPRRDELVPLARTDAREVTALLPLSDGSLALGLAGSAGVVALSPGFAESGTFTSPVLDASAVARLGTLRLDGSLPDGATLTVATRSGNVEEAADDAWSPWSDELPAERFVKIPSPSGRYFQYRLTLKPGKGGSPVVRTVEASYQLPNAAPKIASIDVTGDDASRTVTWDAADPNTDTLTYSLQYRPVGETDWRPLKDKLTDATHEIDTRAWPDGRYQIQVTASDATDNPPGTERTAVRVSATLQVDNTAPLFARPTVAWTGDTATVKFNLNDAAGTVASVHYRLNADEDPKATLPEDGIYDGPAEAVTLTLRNLKPGRNVLTLVAKDDRGNERFETVILDRKS